MCTARQGQCANTALCGAVGQHTAHEKAKIASLIPVMGILSLLINAGIAQNASWQNSLLWDKNSCHPDVGWSNSKNWQSCAPSRQTTQLKQASQIVCMMGSASATESQTPSPACSKRVASQWMGQRQKELTILARQTIEGSGRGEREILNMCCTNAHMLGSDEWVEMAQCLCCMSGAMCHKVLVLPKRHHTGTGGCTWAFPAKH